MALYLCGSAGGGRWGAVPLSPLKLHRKQGAVTNQRQLRTAEPAVLVRSRDRRATDYNDGTALDRSRGRFYRPNDEAECDQALGKQDEM